MEKGENIIEEESFEKYYLEQLINQLEDSGRIWYKKNDKWILLNSTRIILLKNPLVYIFLVFLIVPIIGNEDIKAKMYSLILLLFIVVFLIFIIKIYEKRGIRIINGYIIKKKINIHLLIQRILNNLNNKHYIYQKFEIRKKEETENILILLKIHGGLNNVYLSLLQLYNEPLIIHIGMDRPNKDLLVFWRNMITQILLSK